MAVDALTRLARAARDGDTRALENLVDGTYDQVWRLCAALVDEQSAGDLAQETFGRAVRSLPTFRGDSSARTWLLAIARYSCVDELRSRSRRRRRDATLVSREAQVPDASQDSVAADLLRRLEPARRTAFVLTQVLGLSYDEAAQVCGCPIGTIRSRVARARIDLLDQIDAGHADRSAVAKTRPQEV